jgi:endonuclease/exonuclease/phosphatase (EEP) superfamily protein YafD
MARVLDISPRQWIAMKPVMYVSIALLLLIAAAAAQGNSSPSAEATAAQVNAIYPDVEALYIDLHRNPELAFHEQRTAAKLAERIRALGYETTIGVGGTGIVGVMKNGQVPQSCCVPNWTHCRSRRRPACLSRAQLS